MCKKSGKGTNYCAKKKQGKDAKMRYNFRRENRLACLAVSGVFSHPGIFF